ncbi:MAG: ATPase, T2SS/T4P/T4SS family [Bdellovibrionota bacterium]
MGKTVAEITLTKGDGKAETLTFDKSSIMIGRAPGNDIALDTVGVSRYHARFSIDDAKVVIEDLESTNGTFVNGERVPSATVTPSDTIAIGAALLSIKLVEVDDAEPAPPPAPPEPPAWEPEAPAAFAEPAPASVSLESPEPIVAAPSAQKVETPQPVAPVEEHPAEPHPAEPVISADHGVSKAEDFYWQSLKSFLAPVWEYITDDAVTEVLINGPTEIYYEKKGRLQKSDAIYNNDQLKAAVLNIAQYVGRRVSEEEPYLDARLPDGSRVAVLLPPCSRKGISISIRKFAKEKLTMDKLLDFGSLSKEMIMYLQAAVLLKKNIIVSGGTSSGKTSLLNVVSGLIPDDERILTIEDSAELQLRQEHVVPMETKPPDKKGRGQVTIRDLVKASLRMRPDRIVVGEIRGGEALDLLQAMNTGHSGSMATVHASSPKQALTRMETLSLFSGLEIPMRALREQVSTAIEVIIQASRLADHSRKVVNIAEVNKLTESGDYQVTDIFKFQRKEMREGKIIGEHIWTGAKTGMLEEMELAGLTDAVSYFNQPSPAR